MIDAALWSVFIALLAGTFYFAWPRPPAWDPVMFHSIVLATLHRGELEAGGKQLSDWQARLATALPSGPRPPAGGWTEDPAMLGDAYNPAVRIGTACSWDALAALAPGAIEAIERRLTDVVLVWIGAPALDLPHVLQRALPLPDAGTIDALISRSSQRIVLATRTEGPALVAALQASPGLRDRVRALLLVGTSFDPSVALTQAAFETEIDRVVPWFVLRTDPGPFTLLEPALPPSGRQSFRVLDLGQIDPAQLSGPHLGRALTVLVAAV